MHVRVSIVMRVRVLLLCVYAFYCYACTRYIVMRVRVFIMRVRVLLLCVYAFYCYACTRFIVMRVRVLLLCVFAFYCYACTRFYKEIQKVSRNSIFLRFSENPA